MSVNVHFIHGGDTDTCVDTTNRNGEHAIEIRVRENDESDQVAYREDPDEETQLGGTTNESVENCICLAGATSPAREGDDQSN